MQPDWDEAVLGADVDRLADRPHLGLLVVCSAALRRLRPEDMPRDADRWRILEVPAGASLRPAFVLSLAAAPGLRGAFVPVDNFNALTAGAINGQNGWVATSTAATVAADPADPANECVNLR